MGVGPGPELGQREGWTLNPPRWTGHGSEKAQLPPRASHLRDEGGILPGGPESSPAAPSPSQHPQGCSGPSPLPWQWRAGCAPRAGPQPLHWKPTASVPSSSWPLDRSFRQCCSEADRDSRVSALPEMHLNHADAASCSQPPEFCLRDRLKPAVLTAPRRTHLDSEVLILVLKQSQPGPLRVLPSCEGRAEGRRVRGSQRP